MSTRQSLSYEDDGEEYPHHAYYDMTDEHIVVEAGYVEGCGWPEVEVDRPWREWLGAREAVATLLAAGVPPSWAELIGARIGDEVDHRRRRARGTQGQA